MAAVLEPTISGYHAHVYYDADTKDRAERLRAAIENKFTIEMGRWHDRPIGPHPRWSYQVAFKTEQFSEIVPWLALNRAELTVFVHPNTGDDIADHSRFAMWLGESVELNMDIFN